MDIILTFLKKIRSITKKLRRLKRKEIRGVKGNANKKLKTKTKEILNVWLSYYRRRFKKIRTK